MSTIFDLPLPATGASKPCRGTNGRPRRAMMVRNSDSATARSSSLTKSNVSIRRKRRLSAASACRLLGKSGRRGKVTPSGSNRMPVLWIVARPVEQFAVGRDRGAIDDANENRKAQAMLAVLKRIDEPHRRRARNQLPFLVEMEKFRDRFERLRRARNRRALAIICVMTVPLSHVGIFAKPVQTMAPACWKMLRLHARSRRSISLTIFSVSPTRSSIGGSADGDVGASGCGAAFSSYCAPPWAKLLTSSDPVWR